MYVIGTGDDCIIVLDDRFQIVSETRCERPTFVIHDRAKKFVYAVNETNVGHVSSYKFDCEKGSLGFVSNVETYGADPCHLALSADESFLGVANYTGGNVSVLSVDPSTGHINDDSIVTISFTTAEPGPNKPRQDNSHPHQFVWDPQCNTASRCFVSDLGCDCIRILSFDSVSLHQIGLISLSPGVGPRHFVFDNDRLFVLNELKPSLNVFVCDPDSQSWELEAAATVESPVNPNIENTAAELAVKDSIVYISQRGKGLIASFQFNAASRSLKHEFTYILQYGDSPRHFVLRDDRMLVGLQDSNAIEVLRVEGVKLLADSVVQHLSAGPQCIQF